VVAAGRLELSSFQSAPGGEAGGNRTGNCRPPPPAVSIRPRR